MAARRRPSQRLDEIADAALRTFLAVGFRRARMADIAREAGVSPGLLYTYATDKEALFHLVLSRELGADMAGLSLPAPSPDAEALDALARRAIREIGTIHALDEAMARRRVRDVEGEVAAIVGEHFDRVHRYHRFIALLERSALDRPDLAARFYEKGRRPFVRRLAGYVERRVASGHLGPVPDADVAARFVVETVAWFAYHRFGDYDGASLDDEAVRGTVVQLVTAALVGGRGR
jgi:AcrR family transcriptional regulator